ncbi:protein C19orf12 homolog [Phyllostomus hastatus]|uniref:protein C19orf12 homolog n=1 Tax=Phyllostomus hastatus TaxID=9423 RepID=UPI001E6847A1|nr:protein C19orf12 homolog [Phyllostomus hastatus]
MSVPVEDVMRLLCSICENKKMRATFKHSVRGALITSAVAITGFILGGPPGMAVGGSAGALLGAWMSSGQCQSVPEILMELPPAERRKLLREFMAIVQHLDWRDTEELTDMVMDRKELQQPVVDMLVHYVTNELGAKVSFEALEDTHHSGRPHEAAELQIRGGENKAAQVPSLDRPIASGSRGQDCRTARTNHQRRRPRPAPRGWDDQGEDAADASSPEKDMHVYVGAGQQGAGGN